MEEKEILESIEEVSRKILDNPKDKKLIYQRAELYTKVQEPSKAINDYLAIIELNPNDEIAKVKLDLLRTINKFSNIDIYANPNTDMDPWME